MSNSVPGTGQPRRRWGTWVLLVLALEAIVLAITGLSGSFVHGEGHAERPIVEVVSWFGAASLFHLAGVFLALRSGAPPAWFVVAAGLLFRATFLASDPIQEDDHYRYLWDHGTAEGTFEGTREGAAGAARLGVPARVSRGFPA